MIVSHHLHNFILFYHQKLITNLLPKSQFPIFVKI